MGLTQKDILDARKRWEAYQTELHLWCDAPENERPERRDERIERARKDYAFFVKTYFPHLAKAPCGKFHLDAAKYILKHRTARCAFEWARGHAKSTHMSLLIPLWLKIQSAHQHISTSAHRHDSRLQVAGCRNAALIRPARRATIQPLV